jgi:dolichol-phosphate mannosyltransferase
MESLEKKQIKLSLVIPCFNEQETLEKCVERVLEIADEHLSLEVIIVDDASADKSLAIAQKLASLYPQIVVLHHEKNQGKGAALRTGFARVTGDYAVVQDADLEYDPRELKDLIEPFAKHSADVVFGSRFLGSRAHRVLYFWHSLGNKFLTLLSNVFTDLNLTDMETCYKMFRREVIQGIKIEENRFGFEPEIVAKVARGKFNVYEVGISYYGRTYAEGKKIGWKDGVRAAYCILKYNLFK